MHAHMYMAPTYMSAWAGDPRFICIQGLIINLGTSTGAGHTGVISVIVLNQCTASSGHSYDAQIMVGKEFLQSR